MKTISILYIFLPILVITNTSVYGSEISDSLSSFFSMDVEKGEMAIMWLGNHQNEALAGHASAGFVIRTSDSAIVIDSSSLLSNDIGSLQKIDVIFITHDHGDHFNSDSTIQIQKNTGAVVVANSASFSMLTENISSDKLLQILPDEEITFSGFNIHAIPAEHPVENPVLYIIDFDGFRIFHGSDSAFVQELTKIEKSVDVALVPVGDPSPTASPTDAFEMSKALQTSVAIPMHGTPTQMQNFANMIQESGLQTIVIIPKPLEVISLSTDKTSLTEKPKIPEWVRNIFIWYGEGQISEDDVLNAITFLIENQIIQIDVANQSMKMMSQDMMKQSMSFNLDVPVIMPMIDGYYNANKVYFVHTEVSDSAMADMMSKMINFQTLHVPELKNIPEDQMARVYIFTNGVPGSEPYGGGPFMFQIDVFDSIPGQAEYSQFRIPYLVTWNDDTNPRILTSESEILKAEFDGKVTIEKSNLVVNVPMITWEMEVYYGKDMGKAFMIPRMFESMSGVEGELAFVDENNYVAIFKLHSDEDSRLRDPLTLDMGALEREED
jgi:L-ascorbate metabolism protein UlaG (beta-lactamase superfamily)